MTNEAQKTLVWDVDGVLIWHHPNDPAQDWRHHFAGALDLELWESFQRTALWRQCLRNPLADTRALFHQYCLDQDADHSKGHFMDPDRIIDVWLEGNNAPAEEALRKLKDLRSNGFKCVIGSNQDGLRTPYIKEWLLAQDIGDIPCFISCEIGAAKPDSDFYACIASNLDVEPRNLIMIDDTFNNVEGAQKAGWSGFHIDDRYLLDSDLWQSFSVA